MKKVLRQMLIGMFLGMGSVGTQAQMQANGCGPGGQVTSGLEGPGSAAGYCYYTDGSCMTHPAWYIPSHCKWDSPPPRVLPDKWGALAWNNKTGNYDTSSGEPSKEEARRVALQKCGAGCEIETVYANQCVALVFGWQTNERGFRGTRLNAQRSKAEQEALSACNASKAKNCQIFFSECSLP